MADVFGYLMETRHVDAILDMVPLTVVTDAKDRQVFKRHPFLRVAKVLGLDHDVDQVDPQETKHVSEMECHRKHVC